MAGKKQSWLDVAKSEIKSAIRSMNKKGQTDQGEMKHSVFSGYKAFKDVSNQRKKIIDDMFKGQK